MKNKKLVCILVGMLMYATMFSVAGTIIKKNNSPLPSPEMEWSQIFGSDRNDWGNCVAQTADGGYIVTGTYYRNVWSLWFSYLYLLKTNASGVEEWHQIQGTFDRENVGQCVQQTSDGGYIVAGYQGNGGDYDAVLEKTDEQGNVIWVKVLGSPGVYDIGRSVQQTGDGGYIFLGWTQSYGAGGSDAWLVKTDAQGTELWNRTFGGPLSDTGNCVQQTADGGYIIIGATESYGTEESSDVWLIKTNGNGIEEWNRTFGGVDWEDALNGRQTADGGYVIVGTIPAENGTTDIWLIKTNANGNQVWEKTFGGTDYDTGYSVQQTTDGGYLVTGGYTNPMTYTPAVFVVKTDVNGNEMWSQTYDVNGSEAQGYYGIQSADGGYVITGYTGAVMDAASDVWLFKLASESGNQPNLTIKINGGIGVTAKIRNNGTIDATNVTWSIHVEGGLFSRINSTVTGTIDHLAAGTSTSVSTGMFFGLGKIQVSVTAGDASMTKEGTQVFIFSFLK
jgi:hypothetical protein